MKLRHDRRRRLPSRCRCDGSFFFFRAVGRAATHTLSLHDALPICLELSIGYGIVAPLWGWSHPDWRANRITVDRTEYSRITRNVQIGPDNTWRHSGPVQVVTGPRATAPTSASVPAGTVAPGAAAAVAASQRAGTRTTQPPTTTAQPATTPQAP